MIHFYRGKARQVFEDKLPCGQAPIKNLVYQHSVFESCELHQPVHRRTHQAGEQPTSCRQAHDTARSIHNKCNVPCLDSSWRKISTAGHHVTHPSTCTHPDLALIRHVRGCTQLRYLPFKFGYRSFLCFQVMSQCILLYLPLQGTN